MDDEKIREVNNKFCINYNDKKEGKKQTKGKKYENKRKCSNKFKKQTRKIYNRKTNHMKNIC